MPPVSVSRPAQRLALFASVLCVLAVAAAVLSFVQGNWLGIAWVLMAGVTSNMAWYYLRRLRRDRSAQDAAGPVGSDPWQRTPAGE